MRGLSNMHKYSDVSLHCCEVDSTLFLKIAHSARRNDALFTAFFNISGQQKLAFNDSACSSDLIMLASIPLHPRFHIW